MSMGNGTYVLSNIWTNENYTTPAFYVHSIISILGIILNTGIGIGIYNSKKVMSTQNILVLALICVNCFICGYVNPTYAFEISTRGQQFSDAVCQLNAALFVLSTGSHLLILFLIALHRYFMVVHPHARYLSFGGRKRTFMILMISVASLNLGFIPAYLERWGKFGYVVTWDSCTVIPSEAGGSDSYRSFLFFLAFLLPLVLIVCCYTAIIIVVRKKRYITTSLTTAVSGKSDNARNRADLKVTFVSMTIAILFIITNLPLLLLNQIPASGSVTFGIIGLTLYLTFVIYDPLLYGVGDRNLMKFFRKFGSEKMSVVVQTGIGESHSSRAAPQST